MREEDVEECKQMSGDSPLVALQRGVSISSYSSVIVLDGTPCAVVGLVVRSVISGEGVPWMLATRAAVKHRRIFINNCKAGLSDMLNVCPNLSNYVHAKNVVSVRWLKWMGFTMEPSEPIGVDGSHFHRFYLKG